MLLRMNPPSFLFYFGGVPGVLYYGAEPPESPDILDVGFLELGG